MNKWFHFLPRTQTCIHARWLLCTHIYSISFTIATMWPISFVGNVCVYVSEWVPGVCFCCNFGIIQFSYISSVSVFFYLAIPIFCVTRYGECVWVCLRACVCDVIKHFNLRNSIEIIYIGNIHVKWNSLYLLSK